METAEQASPYPYPSENPSSAAPPRLATLAVPGRRKTPEPPLPPRSPRHPAHPTTPHPPPCPASPQPPSFSYS